MASIKITELTEKTEVGINDVLPIVDTTTNETKKITGANLLNSQYSTNETKTNMKWIDGKNIYRKVITTNDLSSAEDYKNISHGITNMDKVVNIKCIAHSSDNFYFDFNNYVLYGTQIYVFVDNTNIIVFNGGLINFVNYAHFILEYTKTS